MEKEAVKIVTGTFEQGKPSGPCVITYPSSGKEQEIILFKKGIKVEKDDEIGLECQDACLMVWNIIGFLGLFAGVPVVMFIAPQFGEYLIAVPVIWLIYMCCATCVNPSAQYINNM